MIITSCRLLWKETNQGHFSVSIPRTQKIQVQRREQKSDRYWVLKVSIEGEDSSHFFRFYGDKAERESLEVQ